MTELLPYINLIIIPVLMYMIKIERRLVCLETKIELILNKGDKK